MKTSFPSEPSYSSSIGWIETNSIVYRNSSGGSSPDHGKTLLAVGDLFQIKKPLLVEKYKGLERFQMKKDSFAVVTNIEYDYYSITYKLIFVAEGSIKTTFISANGADLMQYFQEKITVPMRQQQQ